MRFSWKFQDETQAEKSILVEIFSAITIKMPNYWFLIPSELTIKLISVSVDRLTME